MLTIFIYSYIIATTSSFSIETSLDKRVSFFERALPSNGEYEG